MEDANNTLLGCYRGLDLTDEKGFFCGKLLADLGADIIKVESPGGDPSRNIGPYYHDIPDPEKSLYWYAYNTNKRGITLDLESSQGRGLFLELAKTADFIIEPSGYLDKIGLGYPALCTVKPDIIVTSIFPFGRSGPYSKFKASDLILMAMGGQMFTSGDEDRPPVRMSVDQAHLQAGAHAAIGTLAALYHRNTSGEGQQVDTYMVEAIVELITIEVMWWKYAGNLFRRAGPRRPRANLKIRSVWPCKDGQVSFMIIGGGFGRTTIPLVEWMDSEGMAGPLKDVDWDKFGFSNFTREENDLWEETFNKFFMKHTKAELYEKALETGIPLAPVNTFRDILADKQLESRDFWQQVEHPELGEKLVYPGFPYRFSEAELSIRRRAPLIGEHNEEVRAELRNSRVKKVSSATARDEAQSKNGKRLPLEGIKVVDFSWVTAGPLITDYLATLGAEVIKIESTTVPDLARMSEPFKEGTSRLNGSYHFNLWNANKLSMGLNISTPRGIEVVKKLITESDIVVEGFTPGKMEKKGLDYESLKKIKPDIIMLSASIQGQTGYMAKATGFGWVTNALCGFTHITGWPDRDGVIPHIAYTDFIVPWYGVIALLAALDYKKRTGKGQYIDVSHIEGGATFQATALLDCTVNNRDNGRMGNASYNAAPHGVYPCQGDDCWCAIAVFTDEEWRAFCQASGNPDWAEDSRFIDLAGRKSHEEELNQLVSSWTTQHQAEAVMDILQQAGVAAGVVKGASDLLADPQLMKQEYFCEVEHPEMGQCLQTRWPIRLTKTPMQFKHAPCFGAHTQYVCHEILGMPDEEICKLMVADVLQIS